MPRQSQLLVVLPPLQAYIRYDTTGSHGGILFDGGIDGAMQKKLIQGQECHAILSEPWIVQGLLRGEHVPLGSGV